MKKTSNHQFMLRSLQLLSSAALILGPGCDEIGDGNELVTVGDSSSWRDAESPCTVHFLGVEESPAEGILGDADEDYIEVVEDPAWTPDPNAGPGEIPEPYLERYPDRSWAQGAALTVQQGLKQHYGGLNGPTKGYGQKTHFSPVIKVVCSDPSITKDDIKVRMTMLYEGDMTLGTKDESWIWGSHALAKAHAGVIGGFRHYNENEGTRLVAWSQNYLRVLNHKGFDAAGFGKQLIDLAKIAADLGIAISKVVPAEVGVGADPDYYNFNEDQNASSGESTLPIAVNNRWGFADDEGNIEPNQPFTIQFHTEIMMQTQVKGPAEAYAKLASQFLLGVVVEYPGAVSCDKDYAGLLVAGVTQPTPLVSYNSAKGFGAMSARAIDFLNGINLPAEIEEAGKLAAKKINDQRVPSSDYSGAMVVTGFGDSYQFGS